MIRLSMQLQLKEKLLDPEYFPVGVELVSTRGTMSQKQAIRARSFAEDLTVSERVDWVSITDNAGGNPQLAPVSLGTPILYGGKDVTIHLTCKDLNRNGLESQRWMLASQGFHNILAMWGDAPAGDLHGLPKAVFDIDSTALLSLINRMNRGLDYSTPKTRSPRKLASTTFFPGAVVNPFKTRENTLIPQLLKLEMKIRSGAGFIVNQIGFDSRKCHELVEYLRLRGLDSIPLIGNVYLLNPSVADLFFKQSIPGVTLNPELYKLCRGMAHSPDKGRRFFLEFAARQIAVYRGLGYRGVYLGGVHSMEQVNAILQIYESFAPDDWKTFSREIQFSQPEDFFLFERNPQTGLSQPGDFNRRWKDSLEISSSRPQAPFHYRLSRVFHNLFFSEEEKGLTSLARKICATRGNKGDLRPWVRPVEKLSKVALYSCRDCGDCSLAETGFLCPESQCAKNMRNGPCGGCRNGRCEAGDFPCIWARGYYRKKWAGEELQLLAHAPVIQNQSLRGTSAWANFWHGKDHRGAGKPQNQTPQSCPHHTTPQSLANL